MVNTPTVPTPPPIAFPNPNGDPWDAPEPGPDAIVGGNHPIPPFMIEPLTAPKPFHELDVDIVQNAKGEYRREIHLKMIFATEDIEADRLVDLYRDVMQSALAQSDIAIRAAEGQDRARTAAPDEA